MYTILVFYQFKKLTKEEEEKAQREWSDLRKRFSDYGVKLLSNNHHAFGTSWNGFLVIEADDFDDYVKFWRWLKDKIRWYILKTQTIIGVKREP